MKRNLKKRKPHLILEPEAVRQLQIWTDVADGEFGCFGITKHTEDTGAIRVVRFFLPEQVCSQSYTKPDKQKMAVMMTEMIRAGYNMGDLRCWAHSHADSGTFWSGEDEATIKELDNDDWYVSIVVNKAGATLARLDLYKPFRVTLHDIEVVEQLDLKASADLVAELKAKVVDLDEDFSVYNVDSDVVQSGLFEDLNACGLGWVEIDAFVEHLIARKWSDPWELMALAEIDITDVDFDYLLQIMVDYSFISEQDRFKLLQEEEECENPQEETPTESTSDSLTLYTRTS
jgi:hypothetical protein